MRFSRKIDYGLILMEALRTSFSEGSFIKLSGIATAHQLPLPFLQKLADTLRRKEYLQARRGQGGGYRLLKDPKKITLKEIMDIFEEPAMMRCMQSTHPEKYCPLARTCPTRKTWAQIEEKVNRIFCEVTIDTL